MTQATVMDPQPNMPRTSWSTMLVLGAVTVLTLDQHRFGAY